jgi:uncharacterized membrane protein
MGTSSLLVFVVLVAVIASLTTGIVSMVRNSEVAHCGSAGWMGWRVGFQALAVVIVLLTIHGSVFSG